ncbi:MAG: protoheme IX farnesyltransferase [Jatrophihabitans sp.]|nr:MAG: protoheme IX farnesyltransferase [Jatrophihabitans sp.]
MCPRCRSWITLRAAEPGSAHRWRARYPDAVTQTPVAPSQGHSTAAPDPVHDLLPGTSGAGVPHGGAPRRPHRSRLQAYVALTKPRIIELLLVTTLPSMILAAGGLPTWQTALATMLGGTLAAGSANALNCYLDRDIDAVMRRTGRRPLARHEVSPTGALIFGLALGVASVCGIGLATNWLAAGLTAAAIAFYVIVYTALLKRRTPQNIVWGGTAGCMPVLIGWSAVTGSLAWEPVALFAVVFFWTPPHTWALAMRYRDDYARAGVPMLPVVASPRQVTAQIAAFSWATVAASLALWPLGAGWVYGALAAGAGVVLVVAAHRLHRQTVRDATAKPMAFFHLSNSYLAFVFVAVAVDTFLH